MEVAIIKDTSHESLRTRPHRYLQPLLPTLSPTPGNGVSPFVEQRHSTTEELSMGGDLFTPSDVERALWRSSVAAKLQALPSQENPKASSKTNAKRKRQR